MWTYLLILLPALLALVAVAAVIWFRREARRELSRGDQTDRQAQRGGGGPTNPEVPK